jgi:hypothetical protein
MKYFRNVLIGIDQLINTITGGSPDETLSSRVYRYRDDSKIAWFTWKFLNWIEENHCENSLEPDDHHDQDVLK